MSEEEQLAEAIRERLTTIECEIDRLTRLAAATEDAARQREYWDFARDLQADACKLRNELSKLFLRAPTPFRRPFLSRLLKALTPRAFTH